MTVCRPFLVFLVAAVRLPVGFLLALRSILLSSGDSISQFAVIELLASGESGLWPIQFSYQSLQPAGARDQSRNKQVRHVDATCFDFAAIHHSGQRTPAYQFHDSTRPAQWLRTGTPQSAILDREGATKNAVLSRSVNWEG